MALGDYVDGESQLGDWRKERPLGRGGFGAITLWRNMVTGEAIAIKCCTKSASEMSLLNHRRWAKEVEILQRLDHTNVVKGLPVPKEFTALNSSLPFMAMEYCNGGDLRKVLIRPENYHGLKEKEVRNVLRDVSSALAYLHRHRITHRDLKPENIVLRDQAEEVVYKLIDLGYAKELDQSSLCSSFVGTLQYLAPELFVGKPYTTAVDYWSLGILGYEVASGKRPFFPNHGAPIWVPLINGKDSIHIAGELDDNGVPVFYSTLPESTHLTRVFKAELEAWLQVLLQLDPETRGHKNGVPAHDLLENILSKQVVHIFSAMRLELAAVSRSDVSTLSVIPHLSGDGSVTSQTGLLLMDKGIVVPEDFTTIMDPKDSEITLYYFELSAPESDQVQYRPQRLLGIVNQISRCKSDQFVQNKIRNLWADGIVWVQREIAKCQQLLCAYQTFLGYIKAQNKALQSEVVQVVIEMTAVSTKIKFAHECFVTDVECLQRVTHGDHSLGVERLIEEWSCCDDLLEPVDHENQATKALQHRASEHAVKVAEFENTPFALSKQPVVLKDKLKCILEEYTDVKRKLRDTQYFFSLCQKLQSELADFVQEEERLIEECLNYLRHMCALLKGIQSLSPELKSLIKRIHTLSWKISSQQRKRQETIWGLQRRKLHTPIDPQDHRQLSTTGSSIQCSRRTGYSSTMHREAVEHCLQESMKARQDSNEVLLRMESILNDMTMPSCSFHTGEM